jgi:hypothetical protein
MNRVWMALVPEPHGRGRQCNGLGTSTTFQQQKRADSPDTVKRRQTKPLGSSCRTVGVLGDKGVHGAGSRACRFASSARTTVQLQLERPPERAKITKNTPNLASREEHFPKFSGVSATKGYMQPGIELVTSPPGNVQPSSCSWSVDFRTENIGEKFVSNWRGNCVWRTIFVPNSPINVETDRSSGEVVI